jgi:hypothetical protein
MNITMAPIKLAALCLCLARLEAFAPSVKERYSFTTSVQLSIKAARSTEDDIERTRAVILKRINGDDSGIICEKELSSAIESESASKSTPPVFVKDELEDLLIPYHAAARLAFDMKHETFDEATFAAFEEQFRSRAMKESLIMQNGGAGTKKKRRWQFWKKM